LELRPLRNRLEVGLAPSCRKNRLRDGLSRLVVNEHDLVANAIDSIRSEPNAVSRHLGLAVDLNAENLRTGTPVLNPSLFLHEEWRKGALRKSLAHESLSPPLKNFGKAREHQSFSSKKALGCL